MYLFITIIRIYKDYTCTRTSKTKKLCKGIRYNINYINQEVEIYLN
jgi:hypothetical protein